MITKTPNKNGERESNGRFKKGYKMGEEMKDKIINALIGNKYRIGKIPWNKGLRGKDYLSHFKNGKVGNKDLKGFKHSEKSKEKMKGRIPWNKGLKGYHIHSQEYIKKIKERRSKQKFPIKDSSIEVKIQNFLKELKVEFFTHQIMNQIKHRYQCDILIPSLNLVIECDGDYWHKYPAGLERDHIRTKELIEKGFKVLRLWEFEIKAMDIKDFKNKLGEVY